MPVHRKRFRIENPDVSGLPAIDHDATSHHIISELRAIRQDMALPRGAADVAVPARVEIDPELFENYRSKIDQYERLKVELDQIYDAISRTKQEIAMLHGRSFDGAEMTKVTGELGAVVGGTEEATQQILEAAEAIDQAAAALGKVTSPEQRKQLSEDVQERVVSIFEACNFQDLTGQRIGKVMTTMRLIEKHVNTMMEIWGGVDSIKALAPANIDDRVGDTRLLNGPKSDGDQGHASQDDIDALFN